MNTVYRSLLMALFLTCILASPANVFSCGPTFPTTVFVWKGAPDIPRAEYIAGRLGIVQQSFNHADLFVAYRYLSGRPLSAKEQIVLARPRGGDEADDSTARLKTEWMSARQAITGDPLADEIPVDADFQSAGPAGFSFYRNINPDAFARALRTLRERAARFGDRSPYVINWVRAQDTAFNSVRLQRAPSPADAGAPALVRADRDYQIASARFYMRDYAAAESLFAAIGRDEASPWMTMSRYLVARSMIREATLLAPNRDSVLLLAGAYLKQLLADPRMQEMQRSAKDLLRICRFRTHPHETFAELDREFSSAPLSESIRPAFQDYLALLGGAAVKPPAGCSDFVDWLFTYGHRADTTGFEHAYTRWQETKSEAWLIATLAHATPNGLRAAMLRRTAMNMPSSAPGGLTAAYWSVLSLIASGQSDLAQYLIDRLLGDETVVRSPSATNLLLQARAGIARTLNEYLRSCCQRPYGIESEHGSGPEQWTSRAALFAPPASTLNRFIPVATLDTLTRSPLLPVSLRVSLSRAAWVRAVLLHNDRLALSLGAAIGNADTALRPFMDPYLEAHGAPERQFAAAFLLLKNPGLHPSIRIGAERSAGVNEIDDFRDNWWYSGNLAIECLAWQAYHSSWEEELKLKGDSVSPPPFLSAQELQTAESETAALKALPAAATYLGRIVTSYAGAHPGDPRIPEALHLVVRASRVGCTDDASSTFSRRAYQILHRRYAGSHWADITKHWY